MKSSKSNPHPFGRHTRLAQCLALALAVGAGSVCGTELQYAFASDMPPATPSTLVKSAVSGASAGDGLNQMGWAADPDSTTHATAATWVVSNCNNSGSGSLRDAVAKASSGDTVDMTGMSDCTVKLQSSIVTSVRNLTIKGLPGGKYPTTVLDGQHTISPLRHTGNGTLTLQDMYLRNGMLKTALSTGTFGGCLYSAGSIELVNSSVKYCEVENTAKGLAAGGGVASRGKTTLTRSNINNNTARNSGSGYFTGGGASGGGIWSRYELSMEDSYISKNKAAVIGKGVARGGGAYSALKTLGALATTINGNTAMSGSGFAHGGGIFASQNAILFSSDVLSNTSSSLLSFAEGGGIHAERGLTAKYSTIADNKAVSEHASSRAGGASLYGDVTINRCTISGNTAKITGGLWMHGRNATKPLSIMSSTISGNTGTASFEGAGIFTGHATEISSSTITGNVESNSSNAKYGAGISIYKNNNVKLTNTIVSGNTLRKGGDLLPSDIAPAAINPGGGALSGHHNFLGYIRNITRPSDSIGGLTDPQLGPLAKNGGVTMTHALLRTSPAIDAGSSTAESDQRGKGFTRVIGVAADIGAFEYGGDRIFADDFE